MDNIVAVVFKTEQDILKEISAREKQLRLSQNLSQELLAKKSGVSLGSLKRFEMTGKISLKSLVKLVSTLSSTKSLDALFQIHEELQSLAQIKKLAHHRKRGRSCD
jgi:transcriptional regulator with XRE-family HTH domain